MKSPDCLLGQVTQPNNSRLSETSVTTDLCLYTRDRKMSQLSFVKPIKTAVLILTSLFKYDLLTLELYLSKRVRGFDPSSTGLDHVLLSRVLPQISAG